MKCPLCKDSLRVLKDIEQDLRFGKIITRQQRIAAANLLKISYTHIAEELEGK